MLTQDFDALSRAFADGTPRRSVLKALAGGWLSACLEPFAVLVPQPAHAQASCSPAAIAACITAADDVFEQEVNDCNDLLGSNKPQCLKAARQRHAAAVKACDSCPSGSRCDGNVCCPNGQATCAPLCAAGSANGQRFVDINFAEGTLLYSQHVASGTGLIDRIVVSQGGKALVTRQTQRGANRASTTTLDYAAPLQGIVHAEVTTSDGTNFVATYDGRSTQPFLGSTDRSTIRMADGSPLPVVTSSVAGLLDRIAAVRQHAISAASAQCGSVGVSPADTFPGCDDCTLGCGAKLLRCQGAAASEAVGCGLVALILAPVCGIVEDGFCIDANNDCNDACNAPGHPCCPVSCPGNHCCGVGNICCGPSACCTAEECCGNFCCSAGQRCANVQKGICCATDAGPPCGNSCCAAGEFCADDAAQICCPDGTSLCGLTCCPRDATCMHTNLCCTLPNQPCGESCCPPNATCLNHTVCCQPPNNICGGACCPPFNACCNGVCCGTEEFCVGNTTCCPRDQVCGQICCPSGQRCANPATQTCAACGAGTVPCTSVGPNGSTVFTCCPPGANCCLGVCCTDQTGHECTGPNGSCGTIH